MITQDSGTNITLGNSGFTQDDGTFIGGNGTITTNSHGGLTLNGGTFTAPSGTMQLMTQGYRAYALQYNGGTFNHNDGTIDFNAVGNSKISLQHQLDLYNVNINMDDPSYTFTVENNNNDFNINGTLTLTKGYLGGWSVITVKGDVLVKSTFGNRPGTRAVPGEVKTSGNVTVTAEANSRSPAIELNTGAVMNVDNSGASIIELILNGGTFNAPTGTMKFMTNVYPSLGYAFQDNGGTFNNNNGTVEFNNPDESLLVSLQQPLDLYNVDVDLGNQYLAFDIYNNDGNDFNVNGNLTLTGGGYLGHGSLITAKGDVFVKSSFGNRGDGQSPSGEIKTSGNITVTAEANSRCPTIELNTGAVMNVDNVGASINELILNGGTFNAPTGIMKFTSDAYGGTALQYNGGTFNHDNGTVELHGRYYDLDVVLQQPLDLYNVDVNTTRASSIYNNGNDFTVDGTLTLSGVYLGGGSLITAKSGVLVKSTFGG
jgi:hypothetical protein